MGTLGTKPNSFGLVDWKAAFSAFLFLGCLHSEKGPSWLLQIGFRVIRALTLNPRWP